MPELAEVERARLDCAALVALALLPFSDDINTNLDIVKCRATEGKIVKDIITREDKIVYLGVEHDDFAKAIKGRRVQRVGRLGKYFYLVMQSSPHILLHLGMAGFVSTKGKEPLFYRKKAKNWANDDGSTWPLRYWKFALTMDDGEQWCFCDSRRLGRIRLVQSGDKDITEVEPLSKLGRDPYLDMPTLEELSVPLNKRKAPIKAVLLDQNGPLCGIGNWLVDEMLFQAAIHPAQRSNTLTATQLLTLHTQIKTIVNTAVAVNAEHKLFPATWLFHYRWGKGRRQHPRTFTLPDGREATVTHQTVGGRTSAIVDIVQQLQGEAASDGEEGASAVDDEEGEEELEAETPKKRYRKQEDITPGSSNIKPKAKRATPAKRASTSRKKSNKKEESESDNESVSTPVDDSEEDEKPAKKRRATKTTPRKSARKAKGGEAEEVQDPPAESVTESPSGRSRRSTVKVEGSN